MLAWESPILSQTYHVNLSDGDVLALEISTPLTWHNNDWTIVLLHGLCGSHESIFMKRFTRKLMARGFRVIRVNLRGCGSGRGLARKIYHCGSSEDIGEVIGHLKVNFPDSPMLLMGFSLGGHISLKLAGELGQEGLHMLKGVIAVSAPIDLHSVKERFVHPNNSWYQKYFMRAGMRDVEFRKAFFNDIPPPHISKDSTIHEYNIAYVVPRTEFKSIDDYYTRGSAIHVVGQIAIPTKVLFAKDDPFVDEQTYRDAKLSACTEVFTTEYGGHLGFIGRNLWRDLRWMDNQVLQWVDEWAKASL